MLTWCSSILLGTVHSRARWQHANHIGPNNAVCFLLSVGGSAGTKPFTEFECQHLLPLISTLGRVCSLTPSCLFSFQPLWCAMMANTVLMIIHRDLVVLFLALCRLVQVCFVLCCCAKRVFALLTDGLRLCYEPVQPAHTHFVPMYQPILSLLFAKSRLQVDKSQLSSYNATWDVDPCVCVCVPEEQKAFMLL